MTTEENKITVTENNKEGTSLSVKSLKRKATYTIYKPNDGYSMFKIMADVGAVPEHLSGYYTSMKKALSDLTFWLATVNSTKDAEWDNKYKDTPPPPPLKIKENKVAAKI
jgi:hypothetical protein